jgi:hypothetical protein
VTGVPQDDSRGEAGEADLGFSARVSVQSLQFEKVPETGARFRGNVSRYSFSESSRSNLPEEPSGGVEYRNASIEWRASGWTRDDAGSERRPELEGKA